MLKMFSFKLIKNLNNNSGMATIEACVIIPLCIGVMMLLFWLGIYYYDKNVLAEGAARAAIYGSENAELSNEDITKLVESKLTECLQEGMILVSDVETSVTVDFNDIIVKVIGSVKIPEEINFGNIYEKNVWEIAVIKRTPRLHNSSFVRTMDLVKKGLK